jgi:holin-like protein
VKPAADILVNNMAFLFVPPGVGLILYFDLLEKEFMAILLSFLLSTFLVLAVVGYAQQRLEKK